MSPVAGRRKSWNGGSQLQGVHYPAPLATHEEVVKNAVVFWDTLRRFHFMINTSKFMVPVIGGKELDLHILYVEVTRRGGFEKVVAEKKWREVGGVFMFSPTTTSASFVLRKHYSTLLYHYEQVHYFRTQGPLSTPTPSGIHLLLTALVFYPLFSTEAIGFCFLYLDCGYHDLFAHKCFLFPVSFCSTGFCLYIFSFCFSIFHFISNRSEYAEKPELALVEYSPKGKGAKGSKPINGCPLLVTDEGSGTIDGKFDCGYLVTVKFGSETLSGVLYHPNQQTLAGSPNPTSSPEPVNAIVPYTPQRSVRVAGSRRRRRSRRRTDPNYPKPNRSGYNFFFAETHFKLKSLYPNREREFTKMIGESWNKLPAEERLVYQNIGLQDKERYKRELKEYKESLQLRIQAGHGN
ncbi:high mobility group B protein 9 isoform X1 [Pyrus x bretschneideri]|uniref:high mobility group B protein 9 isoform X1 n=1 Tax=Pyrus x bretschneideri TaxID=225117 RepID=UPI00202FD681|nr:high mobility group B protein 9 isoform X1 [Pyrus x bretschneideri]